MSLQNNVISITKVASEWFERFEKPGDSEWGSYLLPRRKPRDQRAGLRVVILSSCYRGTHLLNELIAGMEGGGYQIVGVATDEVKSDSKVSKQKRIWRYLPQEVANELQTEVESLCVLHSIACYSGNIKSWYFEQLLKHRWQPDLIIMATFGQLIPRNVIDVPRYGMYNIHPSDLINGKYLGPTPVEDAIAAKEDAIKVSLHLVDEQFDTGKVIAVSDDINLKDEKMEYRSAIDMHVEINPHALKLAKELIRTTIEIDEGTKIVVDGVEVRR